MTSPQHKILLRKFQPFMMTLKVMAVIFSLIVGNYFCAILALTVPVIPLFNSFLWAPNTSPIFAKIPHTPAVSITATTTDKSGATTTNMVDLLTAATDGTKVTRIKAKHSGNSTAGLLLVWITDTAGANPRLISEGAFTAITSSATVASAEVELIFNDLQLKSGQKIIVGATVVTSTIHVHASIGDFS